MEEFKEFDKVIVLKEGINFNKVGVISRLPNGVISVQNNYFIKINDVFFSYEKKDLEKIDNYPKFEWNQEVIFTSNPYELNPRERKGFIFSDLQSKGKVYEAKLLDIKGLEYNNAANTPFIAPVEWIKKIEDKPQTEPFELKEGMKVKTRFSTYTFRKYIDVGVSFDCTDDTFVYLSNVDWEETRKLNEVKEESKEEPKNEKYIVWNQKGNNHKVIHENFINAEREAFRLAKENPNQEFYVLKVVGKAKGSVKVEWSE